MGCVIVVICNCWVFSVSSNGLLVIVH